MRVAKVEEYDKAAATFKLVDTRKAEGLHKNPRIPSPPPPREYQCELHRITSTTGPKCMIMCNLTTAYTQTRTPDLYSTQACLEIEISNANELIVNRVLLPICQSLHTFHFLAVISKSLSFEV